MSPKIYKVTAPLMGTYYDKPGPGEKPFVEIGQKVKATEVVCIIESMKLFTEIRSDQSGTVKKILVENEEPVMKNQELMEIEG
ncbi:MAG: biotin carboxyl carrier domain-containing protein [Deltaproteobacteria bacterium]|nr:MAG: biotin carboxyl carrier domain-containing protein [Deltaproteobacteria bacterium]